MRGMEGKPTGINSHNNYKIKKNLLLYNTETLVRVFKQINILSLKAIQSFKGKPTGIKSQQPQN
jgi:hypothetical protein